MLKLLDKIQSFLYNLLIRLNRNPSKFMELRSITDGSIYPYDLVVSCEDYDNLIKNGFKEGQYSKPIIGTVLAIEKYTQAVSGITPEIVKVFYFNAQDFRYPIIKNMRVEDLKFMSSPIKELVQYSAVMNEVNNIMDELSAEELDNLDSDIEDDDDEEIVQ